jgi:hypothetical protein
VAAHVGEGCGHLLVRQLVDEAAQLISFGTHRTQCRDVVQSRQTVAVYQEGCRVSTAESNGPSRAVEW